MEKENIEIVVLQKHVIIICPVVAGTTDNHHLLVLCAQEKRKPKPTKTDIYDLQAVKIYIFFRIWHLRQNVLYLRELCDTGSVLDRARHLFSWFFPLF